MNLFRKYKKQLIVTSIIILVIAGVLDWVYQGLLYHVVMSLF